MHCPFLKKEAVCGPEFSEHIGSQVARLDVLSCLTRSSLFVSGFHSDYLESPAVFTALSPSSLPSTHTHTHTHTHTEQKEWYQSLRFWECCVCVCVCVARQAPLSLRFSRQEYWNGLPFPSPGESPSQPRDQTSISCISCTSSQILSHWATWEAPRSPGPPQITPRGLMTEQDSAVGAGRPSQIQKPFWIPCLSFVEKLQSPRPPWVTKEQD